MALKEKAIEDLQFNPFTKIDKEWMLITAGSGTDNCNTMTASWGGVGIMWGKNIATVYIRQSRYTKEFVDREGRFTCTFFGEDNQRAALGLLGRVSGRDVPDKIAQAGITPCAIEGGVTFEEADLVFVCRVLYARYLDPSDFVDTSCDEKWYADGDYHTMYMAEIERVLVKE